LKSCNAPDRPAGIHDPTSFTLLPSAAAVAGALCLLVALDMASSLLIELSGMLYTGTPTKYPIVVHWIDDQMGIFCHYKQTALVLAQLMSQGA